MHQIYVLEDSQDIGYILQLLLVNEGFKVEVFPNVAAIKSRMEDDLPACLLSPVRLHLRGEKAAAHDRFFDV